MHSHPIAIVTGATRGIGKAISLKLISQGFFVVGVYVSSDHLAHELEQTYPHQIKMIKADIAHESEIVKVVNFINQNFGRIDVMVNNAGIYLEGKVENFSFESWQKVLAVNLNAHFLFAKYTLPFLKLSQNGVIVNISSRGSFIDQVWAECSAYCSAYGGVNNLTSVLAKELEGTNVRANVVIPTVTNTDRFETFSHEEQNEIIKSGVLGTPDEAAELVMELINDRSKNGAILIDRRVPGQIREAV